MSNVAAPWILYLVGAVIALLTTWLKISPLAFALGMYIPQELNNARFSRGTLIGPGSLPAVRCSGCSGHSSNSVGSRAKEE